MLARLSDISLLEGRFCYTTETVTIASIIGNVGEIFTGAMSWAGTVGETIVGTPILLMFVVIPLVGLGVGLFKRLLNM